MTKEQAWKEFKQSHSKGTFDYWAAQLDWACYTDGLCRDGKITMKQYETWATPFKYGKKVRFK